MQKVQGTGESKQKVTGVTELIQIIDNDNLGSSNQFVRPRGSLSLIGIPPLNPFITHPSHTYPTVAAIQSLRTYGTHSNVNTSSFYAVR